ncbi:MAG: DsbA family protein [Pseudomonadota bacterium]
MTTSKLKTPKLFAICALSALTLATFSMVSCSKNGANSSYEIPSDIAQGSADAKVVMVEYASVTCPHCADFGKDIMPSIKTKYIDTGKIRYVFREFPTPPIEIASAGHLLARCVAPNKREAVLNTLMTQQREIVTQAAGPNGAKQALLNIAASVGMSETDFDKCMQDEAKLQTLVDIRNYAIEKDNIGGTPTIFVNGKIVPQPVGRGNYVVEDVSKLIDEALAKTGGAAK